MRKKQLILQAEILEVVVEILNRYAHVSQYVEQKMFEKELLSTNQVAEKYFVSRHTVGRLSRSGQLKPIIKHRSYYFDAEETSNFFAQYWNKNQYKHTSSRTPNKNTHLQSNV